MTSVGQQKANKSKTGTYTSAAGKVYTSNKGSSGSVGTTSNTVDTNYFLKQGESTSAYNTRIGAYRGEPTSVADVNPNPVATNMPTVTARPVVETATASGYVAGDKAKTDVLQTAEDKRVALVQQQNEQTNSLWSKLGLNKAPTAMETLQQGQDFAMQQTGMNATQFLADKAALRERTATIQKELDSIIQAKDEQIAQATGRAASMSFINNQVAQIERNAAPRINYLTAQINALSAQMAALNEDFGLAQNFAAMAVDAITADKQYTVDLFKTFYEINNDSFSKLDSIYQDSADKAFEVAQTELQNAREDAQQVMDWMVKYPNANIDPKDSPAIAAGKVRAVGGDTGGVTFGFGSSEIEASVREDAVAFLDQVDAGAITLEKAYSRLRTLYSPTEVSDDSLKALLGMSSPVESDTTGETTVVSNSPGSMKFGDINARASQLTQIFKGDDNLVRSQLRKDGYTQAEINASESGSALDAMIKYLFKE